MTKRGVVLIFSLLVVLFLTIILGSFFLRSINENNLVRRSVSSTQAFWAAEGGIAQAIRNLPDSPTNGNFGGYSYETTTAYRTTINATDYYNITSTGIVAFPSGGDIRRTINVVVKKGTNDPTKFRYSIQAANNLCFGGPGQCKCPKDATCPPTLIEIGDPYSYLHPNVSPYCNGQDCYIRQDGTINSADLFGYQLTDISSIATHYTDTVPETISGVTWVDVTPDQTLMVTDGTGSGVLIINGNVQFGGTYQFRGIIYALGTLIARGTFDSYGSIIVASAAGVDSVDGTPDLYWDQTEISNALDALNLAANSLVGIVSWNEP